MADEETKGSPEPGNPKGSPAEGNPSQPSSQEGSSKVEESPTDDKQEERLEYWQSKADRAEARAAHLEDQVRGVRDEASKYVPENQREVFEAKAEAEKAKMELEKERMLRVESDINSRDVELSKKYPEFSLLEREERREIIEGALRSNQYDPDSIEPAVQRTSRRLKQMEDKFKEKHGLAEKSEGESSAAPKESLADFDQGSWRQLGTKDKKSLLGKLGLGGRVNKRK